MLVYVGLCWSLRVALGQAMTVADLIRKHNGGMDSAQFEDLGELLHNLLSQPLEIASGLCVDVNPKTAVLDRTG